MFESEVKRAVDRIRSNSVRMLPSNSANDIIDVWNRGVNKVRSSIEESIFGKENR